MSDKLRVAGGHLFSWKDIARLIIPLAVEQLLSIMIGMADTIMVSSYTEASVSAVSSIDLLSQISIQLFSAFATGGAVIVSQYLGRQDKANAQVAARNLIYVSIIVSTALLVLCMLLKDVLISLVLGKTEAAVQSEAAAYYVPIMFSFPFLAVFNATTAISRSNRKTTRTMLVSVLMNAVNICGNYFMIFTLSLGAAGAACASLISRLIGCVVKLILLRGKNEECPLTHLTRGPVDAGMIKRILRIGLPSALDGSLFQVGKIIIQSMLAGLGTSALAINAVVGNFNAYSNIPGNAVSLALITVVGYSAGAKRLDEERWWTRVMLTLAIILIFIVILPMYIFTPQVVSIYGLSEANTTAAVPICRLCLLMCTFIWPFSFSLPNSLRATGDVRYTMIISIISMWAFRVFLSFVFINFTDRGVAGAWYAMYADWSFRGLMYLIRYKGKKWQLRNVV